MCPGCTDAGVGGARERAQRRGGAVRGAVPAAAAVRLVGRRHPLPQPGAAGAAAQRPAAACWHAAVVHPQRARAHAHVWRHSPAAQQQARAWGWRPVHAARVCSFWPDTRVMATCMGVHTQHRGDYITSGGAGGELRVWDLASREMVAHLKHHNAAITDLKVCVCARAGCDKQHLHRCVGLQPRVQAWRRDHALRQAGPSVLCPRRCCRTTRASWLRAKTGRGRCGARRAAVATAGDTRALSNMRAPARAPRPAPHRPPPPPTHTHTTTTTNVLAGTWVQKR
jgi:hypothetical protein